MPDEPAAPQEQQEIRPPRETTNYGLPVPGDAGPADYVTDTGNLADAIDDTGALFYPGDYKTSGRRGDHPGWLLADGREIRRDLYPALFDAIGEDHGPGDGQETFNLPDFRDRFPVGAGPSIALAARGGAAAVTLTGAEMPHHAHGGQTAAADRGLDHTHAVPAGAAFMNLWTAGGDIHQGGFNFAVGGGSAGMDRSIDHLHAIGAEGGSQPHENRPPFVGVNIFVKT